MRKRETLEVVLRLAAEEAPLPRSNFGGALLTGARVDLVRESREEEVD